MKNKQVRTIKKGNRKTIKIETPYGTPTPESIPKKFSKETRNILKQANKTIAKLRGYSS